MANSKVAILWARADLLGSTIQQLLTRAKDWKIIRLYDESDGDFLAREAERVNPDVVIIQQGDFDGSVMEALKKLMLDHCEMKIITISLENNLVEIYNKQTVSIKEASDLLSIIEKHTQSDGKGGESYTQ